MRTHFLDLAIAVLLSQLLCLVCLFCEDEMVAEQLYSFTLTVFVGLGTDRPIGPSKA